jgi:hypothetical protein
MKLGHILGRRYSKAASILIRNKHFGSGSDPDPAKIKLFLENVEIFHNDPDSNPNSNPYPK